RRRGFFEGPPRALYRRTGTRYFDACALTIVLNGVVVAGFGVVALVLYVDLSLGEVALVFSGSAVGLAVEGALAARYFLRAAEPARVWLSTEPAGDGAAGAWLAAARLPLMLARRPSLYAIG